MLQARNGGCKVVGIHIRHGDYATFEGGAYFYSLEQYLELMKHIRALFPAQSIRFLVCSNIKIEDNLFQGLDYVGGPGHFVEDLYALSQCDFLAGPPSTFTLWASFYGQVPLYMVKDIHKQPQIADFQIAKG